MLLKFKTIQALFLSAIILIFFQVSVSATIAAYDDVAVVDNSVPTTPTKLALSMLTAQSATLTWGPSYGNNIVSGYEVYRDGVKIGTTGATIYVDTGLVQGNSYVYTVRAYDSSGKYSPFSNPAANRFLIIVASPLYQQNNIPEALSAYQADLGREGWVGRIVKINNTADAAADLICPNGIELKQVISNYYFQEGYQGFVLIGSDPAIPTVYWEYSWSESDGGSPCDLYYADLDGEWKDLDNDGSYESYDSTGLFWGEKFGPEMLWGRISAGCISNSLAEEAAKIVNYLNKIHNYRNTGSTMPNRALIFNDDDWRGKDPSYYLQLIGDIQAFHDIEMTNPDQLAQELEKGYQFANIMAHSYADAYQMHSWHDGVKVYDESFNLNRLAQLNPKVHYLNLFNCSVAKYQDRFYGKQPNIGAAFLFDNDYAFNVTGSTGPWGFVPDAQFYRDLGGQSCIGIALRNYFNARVAQGEEGCPKGVLLGDPTLRYQLPLKSNQAPYITNELFCLEANPGKLYSLRLDAVDPENDPVSISLAGLPAGATFDGSALQWTPAMELAGKSIVLTATVSDNHGNSYSESFDLYVSPFQNGIINGSAGWVPFGSVNIYDEYPWHPFKGPLACIESFNNDGGLRQTIDVKPNTQYTLAYWYMSQLSSYYTHPFIAIEELGIKSYCPANNHFDPKFISFNSGNNSRLTIGLHSSISTGKTYFTGFKLFPGSLGFELSSIDNLPSGWYCEGYAQNHGTIKHGLDDTTRYKGNYSAKIDASSYGDVAFVTRLPVKPNTSYRLRGMVKTSELTSENGMGGANIAAVFDYGGIRASGQLVTGTTDWTEVFVDFNSENQDSVLVKCRLTSVGSRAKGVVWFDDIVLEAQSLERLSLTVNSASPDDGNRPANAIDGNTGNRFASQGDGAYLILDMGMDRTLDYLKIFWHKGETRTNYFEIYTSVDNQNYSKAYPSTGNAASARLSGFETYDLPNVTARYIKIVGHMNSVNQWLSINEVEAWGKPLAGNVERLSLNVKSASPDDGNLPLNAIDGNTGTRFSSNGDGAYLTLDLGMSRTLDYLKIFWHKGSTRTSYFEIFTSLDNQTYSKVYPGTGNASSTMINGFETYPLPSIAARYIKIVGHGNSANMWLSINEVEAWGR